MQKVTKPQRNLICKLGEGAIMKNGREYSFSDGSTAHATVVENLIEKGVLAPNNDSLLPGMTQTYSIAGE